MWSGSVFSAVLVFGPVLVLENSTKCCPFFFFVFSGVLLVLFCRSPFLRGCLEMSSVGVSHGTSPSFWVLSWLCSGFFHMLVAGKKLPSQDVLLRLFSWSKRGSFIFRFRGTDLVCNPSHSGLCFC